jgi:thioesterase domain-containing protein/acyl carrier protein
MAMSVSDVDGGHRAEIEFDTDRYDEGTVKQLLRDLDAVLAAGGSDPEKSVGSLQIRSHSAVGRASVAQHDATPAAGLPGSAVWERVASAWAELLGSPPSCPDTDFFSAGGHSLSVVRLAAALEQETGIEIDVVDWLSEPTPRRIVAQLTAGPEGGCASRSAASTVVELRRGTGPHLHLVPGAGGGVHDYRDLLAALPEQWRVTASQEREPLATIPMMAERYRADLDTAGLHPDIIGGWSMGGQVAFELASGLKTPSPALVLLDSTPPLSSAPDADPRDPSLAAFAATVCRSFGFAADRSLPRTEGNLELHMGALAAYLACAGHGVSAGLLADRWRTYDRHARAAAAHTTDGPVDTSALIVGADLLDVQLGQWAALVGPAPRLLRVNTDHHGVLTGHVACEIAAAIADLGRRQRAG